MPGVSYLYQAEGISAVFSTGCNQCKLPTWSDDLVPSVFLPTLVAVTAVRPSGTVLAPSVATLSASSLSPIPWCSGIHTNVTSLISLSLPSTCTHSQTKDDSVVDLQMLSSLSCYQNRCIFYSLTHSWPEGFFNTSGKPSPLVTTQWTGCPYEYFLCSYKSVLTNTCN